MLAATDEPDARACRARRRRPTGPALELAVPAVAAHHAAMRFRHALPALLLLPACVVQAVQPELPPTEVTTTVYLMSAEGRSGFNWTLYTAFADSSADSSAALGRARPRSAALGRARPRSAALGREPIYNPLYGVYFVRARVPYSMWFNCTDATAIWLAMLGIETNTGWICKRIVGPLGAGILPHKEPPDRPTWE